MSCPKNITLYVCAKNTVANLIGPRVLLLSITRDGGPSPVGLSPQLAPKIAPAFIIQLTAAEMNVDYDSALMVVQSSKARQYGGLVYRTKLFIKDVSQLCIASNSYGAARFQGQGFSHLFLRGERDLPSACRPLGAERLERRVTLGVVGSCGRRSWILRLWECGCGVMSSGSKRGLDGSMKVGPPSVRGVGESVQKPKI